MPMNEKQDYTIFSVIYPDLSFHWECKIGEIAIKKFSCLGVEEYQYTEEEVDALLGERSYSGGDLPPEVYEEIEGESFKKKSPIVNFYFATEEIAQDFENWISVLSLPIDFKKTSEKVEDWDVFWRKHYDRIELSEGYSIVPSWKKENGQNPNKEIYIYPGRGFGTGSHETTFLCLEMFLSHEGIETNSVLDFGCGSGILGLGVLRKDKRAKVTFCDIDPEALENTRVNLDLNSFQNSENCLPQDLNLDKRYDLIFANILKNVLKEKSFFLFKSLKNEGHLILSGILKEQRLEIEKVYKNYGLNLVDVKEKGDWSCLLFYKEEENGHESGLS